MLINSLINKLWTSDYSYNGVLSDSVHQQHTYWPAEDGKHGQVWSGQIRGGGHSDSVLGQDPHTVGRQGADAEAVRRTAGRGRSVPAGAHPGRFAFATALEKMERVRWLRLVQTADGHDDARVVSCWHPETGQRHWFVHCFDQSTGEQLGERTEQLTRVRKMYGKTGLSAGRPRRQIWIQTTSVLVRIRSF